MLTKIKNPLTKEIVFFGSVGILSNVSMFFLYVTLVGSLMDSKAAVTVTYILNLLISFYLNKRITFSSDGDGWKKLKRFFLLYLYMYIFNIVVLFITVDKLFMPPDLVQGSVFLAYIPIVFLLQRYWVFSKTA